MEKDLHFNLREETLTHAITVTKIFLEEVKDRHAQLAYLEKLERRLSDFPASEELLFYGIKLLFELDQYETAIKYLTRFLKRDGNCRSAWTFLARAILDLDEVLASACACRAMLLAENPILFVNTPVELILCLSRLRNFDGCHRLLPLSFFQEGAYLADEALEL